ncbi:MAG: CBO2463/CBO2479 domain-containing protein [Gallibacter sp.]|nr:CBO2463/CBO2479 domain-containing protein [Gallibacter sp.]
MEGIVVEIDDCSIAVDLKGRLGYFKAPKRMFISDTEPKVGQVFGWNMSFPEQLSDEVNEKYITNIKKHGCKKD